MASSWSNSPKGSSASPAALPEEFSGETPPQLGGGSGYAAPAPAAANASAPIRGPPTRSGKTENSGEEIRGQAEDDHRAFKERISKSVADDMQKWGELHANDTLSVANNRQMITFNHFSETRWKEGVLNGFLEVSRSPAPHDDWIWEAAAEWKFELVELTPEYVPDYLRMFGYNAQNGETWLQVPSAGSGPQLQITLNDGAHEEHATHTWYMLECDLGPIANVTSEADQKTVYQNKQGMNVELNWTTVPVDGNNRLVWKAPRRLQQLRSHLHDPVQENLGTAYKTHFGATPFASHGGPSGTTQRLANWLKTLTELINTGKATPDVVARTIVLLRGLPDMEATATGVVDAPDEVRC